MLLLLLLLLLDAGAVELEEEDTAPVELDELEEEDTAPVELDELEEEEDDGATPIVATFAVYDVRLYP